MIAKARAVVTHFVQSIDGVKRPPKVIHRAHRIGHLLYFGSLALGLHQLHDYAVPLMFGLELASICLGREELRDAVIEFE